MPGWEVFASGPYICLAWKVINPEISYPVLEMKLMIIYVPVLVWKVMRFYSCYRQSWKVIQERKSMPGRKDPHDILIPVLFPRPNTLKDAKILNFAGYLGEWRGEQGRVNVGAVSLKTEYYCLLHGQDTAPRKESMLPQAPSAVARPFPVIPQKPIKI